MSICVGLYIERNIFDIEQASIVSSEVRDLVGGKKREDCSFLTLCLSVLFKCFNKNALLEILRKSREEVETCFLSVNLIALCYHFFTFSWSFQCLKFKKKVTLNKSSVLFGFHSIIKNV